MTIQEIENEIFSANTELSHTDYQAVRYTPNDTAVNIHHDREPIEFLLRN